MCCRVWVYLYCVWASSPVVSAVMEHWGGLCWQPTQTGQQLLSHCASFLQPHWVNGTNTTVKSFNMAAESPHSYRSLTKHWSATTLKAQRSDPWDWLMYWWLQALLFPPLSIQHSFSSWLLYIQSYKETATWNIRFYFSLFSPVFCSFSSCGSLDIHFGEGSKKKIK